MHLGDMSAPRAAKSVDDVREPERLQPVTKSGAPEAAEDLKSKESPTCA